MHLAYTPEQERLRQQLREYFAGLMTPELRRGLAEHAAARPLRTGDALRP